MYKIYRTDNHPARITNSPALVAETDDIEQAAEICRKESRRGPNLDATVMHPDGVHRRPLGTYQDGTTVWG